MNVLHKNFMKLHGGVRSASGYILILTLLVISILLAVGFSISALSTKEVILASFLRDSERALAAAVSGAECALYWDRAPSPATPKLGLTYTIFATGTSYTNPPNLLNAVCHNGTSEQQLLLSDWEVDTTVGTGTTMFSLEFTDGTCADILVTKVGNESTTIVSDGYNTCTVALPRRTQREIAVFSNI
ncbi:MAG: hypothetical protein A3D65_00645 [Candidatus Lloydbacteria bacterium RIFCSPHIGHO2_02_FULL_50_13]|uniref:Type 4 fimbrial biogenesis protein PilX N-terminal domain-containing protein n=1 Tax=Candidatus Lloydbacteria bacterium RIFCSPHIGHO2_02_FULL_50_13 TaxID=1798661 RepID=A0A1G2D0D7_9BACT|nr:MAG: hypothetical protein A3D65_00645 [Candidatus Lloydbacteria bacterium RIFCSPHIGHO2_02_FULL_50_13]